MYCRESWQFTRCGGKTKSVDVEGVTCGIRFDVIVITRAEQGCQALLFIVQVYRQLAETGVQCLTAVVCGGTLTPATRQVW